MKCIKLKQAGIDVCVTIKVKPIFLKKSSEDLKEELDRLETRRVLEHLGARQEAAVAERIVREFEDRKEVQ
ncbi:MAG: hypothetical protein J7M32_04645 [Deltaproteobacteria bacterium]|nr:hypothetical protein [Deltaproteobacteria bacterium]OQX66091.1 MAG: hypothetical protein B5M55_01315 [Desulfococcus sp. 4484_242]